MGLCLAYVAFIEGNFPQCGPQYIAVFGGTIPLLVRIMWALPMHYPGHFPRYTQDKIMEWNKLANLPLASHDSPCRAVTHACILFECVHFADLNTIDVLYLAYLNF